MFRKDMTEEEVKNLGKELGNYIIEKLKYYGLYLDFREPEVDFHTKYNSMSVYIWCFNLTPDISESDEDVLGKFISYTFKEFIKSHDFFNHLDRYCECTIYADKLKLYIGFDNIRWEGHNIGYW